MAYSVYLKSQKCPWERGGFQDVVQKELFE